MHAATSKVENLVQGLSCQLKFVHDLSQATQSKGETTVHQY